MFIEPITWNELELLNDKNVILFGTEKPAHDLVQYIN